MRVLPGSLQERRLATCNDPIAWDRFVGSAADGSALQSWAWGELKVLHGWRPTRYFWLRGAEPVAAASVLRRALPGGLAVHYAPRGPVLDGHLDEWPGFWSVLRPRLALEGGTSLKLDPEWSGAMGRVLLEWSGGAESHQPIQHQATMMVDLRGGNEALARFKDSARRNMRLAEGSGITVEASVASPAMDAFYGLLQQTAQRQRFIIRPLSYFRDVREAFASRSQLSTYIAHQAGHPVAGAVMLFYGRRMTYLFSGSNDEGRALRAPYLIQKRAIEEAQRRGCTSYDMFGVPLHPLPGHPGYGYYQFKSMFNGDLLRYIGLFDLPVREPMALALRVAERVAHRGSSAFL